LRGREQEWNISRKELEVFWLNLLCAEVLEQAITQYNLPALASWMARSLGAGRSQHRRRPSFLLETLKCVSSPLVAVCLKTLPLRGSGSPDGVMVAAQFQNAVLLDAMGHFSPLGAEAQRGKSQMAFAW